jgi:hypothetical protein
MKTTNYHFAGITFKGYLRTAGQGFEVCVFHGKKNIFTGNFVHKVDAMKWWTTMNQEIRSFTKTYWIGNKNATTWYATFFSNHLYKCYYKFLDKVFVKHSKTYNHAVTKNVRKYNSLRKVWTRTGRHSLNRAA